jgi:hypothetical protein
MKAWSSSAVCNYVTQKMVPTVELLRRKPDADVNLRASNTTYKKIFGKLGLKWRKTKPYRLV